MMSASENPTSVLVVEDCDHDLFFFEHAFNKAKPNARLFCARDGVEAISFLQSQLGAPHPACLPNVIFLDLKMPESDGFDVLRWLKTQSLLSLTKVCVLSGSSEDKDIQLAAELGASEYLVKPVSAARLARILSGEHLGTLGRVRVQRPAA